MPLGAGLILGGLTSLAKMAVGAHQNHLANKINPVYTPYATSEYAKNKLGMAKQAMNGRMAGAGTMENNIYATGANAYDNVSRAATDGSQALAAATAIQGQQNDAFSNLQTKEAQNKYSLLDNLNEANDTMIGEDNKVYQDKLMKFQMDSQQKAALRGAAFQNIFGGANDLASGFMQNKQQEQQNSFNQQYLNMMGDGSQNYSASIGGMAGGLTMGGYNAFKQRGF